MAVSLYIHIPFCDKKCPYCGFYSVPVSGQQPLLYIKSLLSELDGYRLDSTAVKTVYIGGGSPSVLPGGALEELIVAVKSRFDGIDEFTVEVNPSQISFERLNHICNLGVNRLSIGVQSFRQSDLDFLGRSYSVGQVFEVYEAARRAGFGNISLDMIFALPGTDIEGWKYNLATMIDLGPEHVSAYSLTYEKGTPLRCLLDAGRVTPISEELDREMYELTIDRFDQAGIYQYEISNFAKPGFECRHNKSYWHNTDYIGIGSAAGSFYNHCRYENVADVSEYIGNVNAGKDVRGFCNELSSEQIAHETAVLMLRLREGINLIRFKAQTGYDAPELFAAAIEENISKGLLEKDDLGVRLSRSALAVADSVICDFA